MAGKDYAQIQRPTESPPELGRARNIVVIAGILLVVAASFAGGFWLGNEHGHQQATSEDEARLLAQIKKQNEELNALRKAAKKRKTNQDSSTTQVGDLTFYNELPRQSVTPAPLTSAPGNPAKKPADSGGTVTSIINRELSRKPPKKSHAGRYRLQVGSYQRRDDAEALKSQLAALSLPASVQEVQLPELGVWYRVYMGPYASHAEAESARSIVRKKLRISGLLLRE